jgi:hypothetical protein
MISFGKFCEEGYSLNEVVALRMNQAFKFLCEKFQPKLINSYSNFQRFFSLMLLGTFLFLLNVDEF